MNNELRRMPYQLVTKEKNSPLSTKELRIGYIRQSNVTETRLPSLNYITE